MGLRFFVIFLTLSVFSSQSIAGAKLKDLVNAIGDLNSRSLGLCSVPGQEKMKAARSFQGSYKTPGSSSQPSQSKSSGRVTSPSAASDGIIQIANSMCKPKASLVSNQQDSGSTLGEIKPMPESFSGNPSEFISAVAPFAVAMQNLRGWPASVLIAQAAHESAWGKSAGYTNRKSLFGHSCFNDESKDFPLKLGEQTVTVTGECDSFRPSNEGGKYLSFKNPVDSMIAYYFNVMDDPKTAEPYADVRGTMSKVQPPQVANWQEIVGGLKRYAADPEYQAKITKTIETYGLEKFDKMGCDSGGDLVASVYGVLKGLFAVPI